jgi:hypothetical protein
MAQHGQSVRVDLDVCPNCGAFAKLGNDTGWCAKCSPPICPSCGNEFSDEGYRKVCSTCRERSWLERNADRIEYHLSKGLGLAAAKAQVRRENRPACLCCGTVLDQGFFCVDKLECRKAFFRYKWLRYKGIPRETALREAVYE